MNYLVDLQRRGSSMNEVNQIGKLKSEIGYDGDISYHIVGTSSFHIGISTSDCSDSSAACE